MPGWHVHISPKHNHAGQTLHIEIGHKKTLVVYYFHLVFPSMLESRSIASLLQSGISVHTRANLFHMSLLLFGFSSNQPPAKKQCGEKGTANLVFEKWKTNRKWQDSWKSAASGEERLWLTDDEATSGISDHRTSSYIVECTTFNLEEIKDQERSTLHEHCIKIAQAKKDPSQTDGAPT